MRDKAILEEDIPEKAQEEDRNMRDKAILEEAIPEKTQEEQIIRKEQGAEQGD